jgi:hypothetical protein
MQTSREAAEWKSWLETNGEEADDENGDAIGASRTAGPDIDSIRCHVAELGTKQRSLTNFSRNTPSQLENFCNFLQACPTVEHEWLSAKSLVSDEFSTNFSSHSTIHIRERTVGDPGMLIDVFRRVDHGEQRNDIPVNL